MGTRGSRAACTTEVAEDASRSAVERAPGHPWADDAYGPSWAFSDAPEAPDRTPDDLGSPLLAYYHQSDPNDHVPIERATCPNRSGFWMLNLLTGATFPARCDRVTCTYCAHHMALRRAAAIALARPGRAILLTDVGDTWPDTGRVLLNTRRNLRRMGIDPGEWVAHVEVNPAGTGRHVHAWQHGPDKIPVRSLSLAAERAGAGGFARISRVRSVTGASAYGLKGVAEMGYGLKGTEDLRVYLDANGGRLTHQTRGFFRAPSGKPLSVRGAEDRAVELYTGKSERLGKWEVVSASYLAALSSRTRNVRATPSPA
jgi:hypothetical protein